VKVAPWLSFTVQNLASPEPEYGSDRTFGCVSTTVGRRADLPWAGVDGPVVTESGNQALSDILKDARECSSRRPPWPTLAGDVGGKNGW
jgi:hypothetical protein